MKSLAKPILLFMGASLVLFGVIRCGENAKLSTAQIYGGPGSVHTLTLNSVGDFTLTRAPSLTSSVNLVVSGTYLRYDSGFVELLVAGVSGPEGPASGDALYGVEISGRFFALGPLNSGGTGKTIALLSAGDCPTTDFTGNWVALNPSSGELSDSLSNPFFGTLSYVVLPKVLSLPAGYAVTAGFPSTSVTSPGAGVCAGGTMTPSGGASVWLTPGGGVLSETSGKVLLGLPASAFNLTDLDGAYTGFLYNSLSGLSVPVAVTATGGSTLSIYSVTGANIEQGTTPATSIFEILITSSADTPSAGFFQATIQANGGATTGNVSCNRSPYYSRNVVVCTGQNPDDNSRLMSLVLVSK